MVQDLLVGKSYEVQTKDFHRSFVGKITDVTKENILVEIEHLSLVDSEMFKMNSLIKVDRFDIKRQLEEDYFFS